MMKVLQAWATNVDYLPPPNQLKEMAHFPTGEMFTIAAFRLQSWIVNGKDLSDPNNMYLKEAVMETIKLIGSIGQRTIHYYNPETDVLVEVNGYDTLDELVKLVEIELNQKSYFQEIRSALMFAKQKIEGRGQGLLGSLNLVNARNKLNKLNEEVKRLQDNSKSPAKDVSTQSSVVAAAKPASLYEVTPARIEKFKKMMNTRLRGQQRVKDRYTNIMYEIMTNGIGRRTKPYVSAYKMGAPGNGKDTSTEVFVDGLFDKKNAYTKLDGGVPLLFRLPVMKRNADLWKVLGSATGYKGSGGITTFVRWLVKFSAGRYQIINKGDFYQDQMNQEDAFVIENAEWKPGMVLDGYLPPELGVVFANEFHNWSKSAKDEFLKQFIEKGYVSLNNPGRGVSELYVPVNIDIASNEGIGLISPREADGRVVGGRPKSYEEASRLIELYADKPEVLRNEILKTNGFDSLGTDAEYKRGISEETLNRIPDSAFVLMENTSPENLKLITEDKLEKLEGELSGAAGYYGSISFGWSKELVKFIQEYKYNAEANARPIEDKVNSFVRDPIFDAIKSGLIKGNNNGQGHMFDLDLEVQPNRLAYLVFKNIETGREDFKVLIRATKGDVPREPVGNEKLANIMNLKDGLKNEVFGVDEVLEKLQVILTNIESSQNRKRDDSTEHTPAHKVALFGLSGAGKTEVTKRIADKVLPGGVDDLFIIDFNTIHSIEELTKKLYGEKRGETHIKSDFMNMYDRIVKSGGTLYVALEEFINANPAILHPMYPMFDEAVVKLFSDNEARPMTNVVFMITGNVGTQMYQAIPKNIPETEKNAAYVEMYRQFVRDRGAQRRALEKEMPVALVNRIPENNVVWFGPQNFATARQVTMKLVNRNVEKMVVTEGDRGWNVVFDTEKDYLHMVEVVEEAAFTAETQGRGIRDYVNGSMSEGTLRFLLIKNNVRSGSQVVLKAREEKYEREFRGSISSIYAEVSDNDVIYDVATEDGRSFEWRLARNERQYFPTVNPEDQIITAAHEAGHNIVGQILMGDKDMNDMVTIIPGVANIEDQWIRYLGLASTDEKEIMIMTKQAFIQMAARLIAGSEAQKLVTVGARDDSGKSNDIERANALLTYAIIKAGVFKEWGNYKANSPSDLTGERRKLYEKLLNASLVEAQALARKTLLLNYDSHLVPMMLALAEKGILLKPELDKFYAERTARNPYKFGSIGELTASSLTSLKARFASRYKATTRDAKLLPHLPRPATVSGTEAFVRAQKEKIVSKVEIPASAPIRGKTSNGQRTVGGSCSGLF